MNTIQEKKHHDFLTANMDFDVRSLDAESVNESEIKDSWWSHLKYLVAGILFGVILVKSEVISWFRIQEMFRLQSFHMFGVIGSAVVVGMLSVWLIKKYKVKSIYGETITFKPHSFSWGQVIGGLLFGLGWAITGACPG